MEIKLLLPKILVLFSSISLLILIPILERRNKKMINQILKLEERINREKLNITWDSIQKIKIQLNDHFQLLNLNSQSKKYLYNAMTKILLNNLGCASKKKVSIKEFSKKSHEEIIKEIDRWLKKNKDEVNELVREKKRLEGSLSKLEGRKFFIYMFLVSLQSVGLVLAQ